MLKDDLCTRQQTTKAEIVIFIKQQVEETTLLKEIWKNKIREQKVWKELKKDNSQVWKDNSIVYVNRKIYIPNN